MRKIIIGLWLMMFLSASYFLVSRDIHWSLSELPYVLQNSISGYGNSGIFIFIGATIVRPLLLLPSSAMMLVGGILFGPMGMVYSLIGETIGSSMAFYIARYVGHDFVESHTGQKFKNFEHKLEKHTFRSIFLLRIMMIVPNDLISYAAGVSHIIYPKFLVASTIGYLPHIILFNSAAVSINDISSLIWPSLIVMLSVLFGKTIHYEYEKHKKKHLRVIAEVHDV